MSNETNLAQEEKERMVDEARQALEDARWAQEEKDAAQGGGTQ